VPFSARVLLDSIGPYGSRLTTLEVTFPRFVLAEFNTHRQFCLDGETRLYFDLPKAKSKRTTRRSSMTLREIYDEWQREGAPSLRAMNLRSCDEETGLIEQTHICNVTYSGKRVVFRLTLADGKQIAATADHLFLTDRGWLRLEDAAGLTLSAGGVASWSNPANFAVNGVEAHRDAAWLQARRDDGRSARAIAETRGVSLDTPYAEFQGRMGARVMRKPVLRGKKRATVRRFVPVKEIECIGARDTYDVEVEGAYHNFVADGFIVHNSRNSASSRAIPTSKIIERVESDPVLPVEWGVNRKGMSASEMLTPEDEEEAKRAWLDARDAAVEEAQRLHHLHVHKQVVNRLLEPFLWQTVIVTATEWDNFFELRCAPNAQPEIREAALRMRAARDASTPQHVAIGGWHLPLVQADERALDVEILKKISAARCARVSYLTHSGTREIEKDLDLYERLREDRHLSPFEHVATPSGDGEFHANFRGWFQMRQEIESAPRAK
jgi:hypothetical protein